MTNKQKLIAILTVVLGVFLLREREYGLTMLLCALTLVVIGADLFQPDALDEKHKPLR